MPIKEFYHVSCLPKRFPTLPQTLALDLACLELPRYSIDPAWEEFKQLVKEYYPEGLSTFGKDYLMEPVRYERVNGYGYISNVMSIDAYFELVRRLRFSDRPSRYQSFFAWETLSEAQAFNQFKTAGQGEIFKVISAKAIRLDANWLKIGQLYLEGIIFAEKYWKGEASENPSWEWLLRFPVTVIEQVV